MSAIRLVGSDGRLKTWDNAEPGLSNTEPLTGADFVVDGVTKTPTAPGKRPLRGVGSTAASGSGTWQFENAGNKAAAEGERDTYFGAGGDGEDLLPQYNRNRFLMIEVVWQANPGGSELQRRTAAGDDWEAVPAGLNSIAAGAWVEIVGKADAGSIFGALQPGAFWFNASTDTPRPPAVGDVYRDTSFLSIGDVSAYDLTLEQPLIDTTALADPVSTNRFGRTAFNGQLTGISNIAEIAIFNRALPTVRLKRGKAGVNGGDAPPPVKRARTTAVYPLAFFLADAVEGKVDGQPQSQVIVAPATLVGNLRMGVQDGQRQEWTGQFSQGVDSVEGRAPTIYTAEDSAA